MNSWMLYVISGWVSDDNFRKPLRRKFIFAQQVYLQGISLMYLQQRTSWVFVIVYKHFITSTQTRLQKNR